MRIVSLAFVLFCAKTTSGEETTTSHHGPCRPDSNRTVEPGYEKVAYEDFPAIRGGTVYCARNGAEGYPCLNVNLESFIPVRELNGGGVTETNDLWGWTSPDTGIEYALVGLKSGTSFVSLEDPNNPVALGLLFSYTSDSTWRDIKTYKNYAFVVSEASDHGMQVFDLTQLDRTTEFTFFFETVHYNSISNAHNIAINEDTGFAYIVGANGNIACGEGIHIVNITDPLNPSFSACFSQQGYTHDVQCVIYDGPDTRYTGSEICFASNENQVDIVDVSDKTNTQLISTFLYPGTFYTHQGWLTEDHQYFIIDDESDEMITGIRTRSIICDATDLENPILKNIYEAESSAIDHNMYVKGKYVYQANYRSGLRILDINSISDGIMEEVAFFDVYPDDDENKFNGAWSNYPFFKSGLIIVSSIERGLFVLRMETPEVGRFKPILFAILSRVISMSQPLILTVTNLFGKT